MPLNDTILHLSDSTRIELDSLQQLDSIFVADSLARVDSIAYADSVRLHAFKGYEGLSLAAGPSNQTWVFLLLLLLFGIGVLSFVRSIVPPWQLITSYFSSKNRTSIFSKTSIDTFEQKLYFFLFSTLNIALVGYLIFYTLNSEFSLFIFLKFWIVVLVFFAIKYVLAKLVEYVFLDKNTMKLLFDSYISMVAVVSLFLYFLALWHIYSSVESSYLLSSSVVVVIVLGLFVFGIRLIQIFLHKFADSLYLMLYLCTLEILPVLLLIQVFRSIATNV